MSKPFCRRLCVVLLACTVCTLSAFGVMSGWMYALPSQPYFYVQNEASWVYVHEVPMQFYNTLTMTWSSVGPEEWMYVQWPYVFSINAGAWVYVLPPATGLWVFHFNSGTWENLPRL